MWHFKNYSSIYDIFWESKESKESNWEFFFKETTSIEFLNCLHISTEIVHSKKQFSIDVIKSILDS